MICPINLECERGCPNYRICKNLSLSWEIPYYKNEEGALIVKIWGWRYKWTPYNTYFGNPMNRCPLPSGQYLYVDDEAEEEIKERLRQSWKEAGWYPAEPISIYIDKNEIEIPF